MQPMGKKWCYAGIAFLIILIAALIGARYYLNVWLPRYVNQRLAEIPGYKGSIEGVDIALYRGAYRIHELKIFKKNGHIPTPFVYVETADLSISWNALFHGRIVSHADLTKPIINFAVDKSGRIKQTGVETDWTKVIKDLMPIDINHVTFIEGKLSYRDFSTTPKVNIYIHHMTGEVKNLRNVVDKNDPLPSVLLIKGDSIGNGTLNIQGRLNILKPTPDFNLNVKLENVHLPALSDYSNAYAAIDIREGTLNLYSNVVVKNNHISGYIKPIATHVALIDLRKSDNPAKMVWEAVVAAVVEIFTNHSKDQFATKVPLEGNLDNVNTNTWSVIGGIIRNAFVSALKKGFDFQESERK